MASTPTRLYEGLFLLSQSASTDLGAATDQVRGMLERHGAEILILRKWDERKLAYPIKGQKRGLYILAYFKAPTVAIAAIDRDCVLSETILRALMLQAEHVGEVELELAKREAFLGAEVKLREDKPVGERDATVTPAAADAVSDPSTAPAPADDAQA